MGLDVIDRFFATGVCPVDLKVLSEGFNIATAITDDFTYNSMIGLTHAEVRELLECYDKPIRDEIYDIMRKNYGGYLFSDGLGEEMQVFNTARVMYFLNYYNETNEYPKELVDNNISINYEKLDNLLRLQGNDLYKKIVDDLLKNGGIIERLKTIFSSFKDFGQDDIISLLYYFGYLTVLRPDDLDIVFKIPNEVMREAYNKLKY